MSAIGAGGIPGYWMNETTGVLRPIVHKYLAGDPLDEGEAAIMRAYLRQWIEAAAWRGDEELEQLRRDVDGLTSRLAIAGWLERAIALGIDPL